MNKKLMLLVAILAMVMVAAAPVLAQIGPEFADQELESGDIETETSLSIEGNNNNQCAGVLQFNQSGNFANQQGTGQYDNPELEQEFAAPEYEFAPENATECAQEVQQAAAASSSWGW